MKEYMLYLEKMKMILGIDRERKIVNIKGLANLQKQDTNLQNQY